MTSITVHTRRFAGLRGPWKIMLPGALAALAYLAAFVYSMNHAEFEVWVLFILVPLLWVTGVVIIQWVTAADLEPRRVLLVTALTAKMAAALVRFYVAFELYGSGDSLKYHTDATERANAWFARQIGLGDLLTPTVGTRAIRDYTAMLYSVMGPSRLGGFIVFSWIGYWGLFLLYRAFLTGLPEGDAGRYAMLLFFLPSLLFWPSSIGKEAVMMLAIGICALGAARVSRRAGGWFVLAIGLVVGGTVRPHVSAVILVAMVAAVLFRRQVDERHGWGISGRFVGVAILVVGLAIAFGRTAQYLVPQETAQSNAEVVGAAFERAAEGTADGSSEIDKPLPNSPIEYPFAAYTVLLRPTILEARSLQQMAAATETTLLSLVILRSWRRLGRIPRTIGRRSYVLFCLVYVGIFCFAWSTFGNLGALARQRVQVWPLMLVLLALPAELPAAKTVLQRTRRDGALRAATPVP